MPKSVYLVFTRCTDPARELEFNRWYAHTHVPDLGRARGFVRARRFVQRAAGSGENRYLCQYEFDSDDPAESVKDLLRLALHAFEGKTPFSDETIAKIDQLKAVYELDLTAADSHQFSDGDPDDEL